MTFDPLKPCRTKGGQPARIICTDKIAVPWSLCVLVMNKHGTEDLCVYHMDGSSHFDEDKYLINIPEEHERLVYLLPHGVTLINSPNDTIASKLVTFTEGEFHEDV